MTSRIVTLSRGERWFTRIDEQLEVGRGHVARGTIAFDTVRNGRRAPLEQVAMHAISLDRTNDRDARFLRSRLVVSKRVVLGLRIPSVLVVVLPVVVVLSVLVFALISARCGPFF